MLRLAYEEPSLPAPQYQKTQRLYESAVVPEVRRVRFSWKCLSAYATLLRCKRKRALESDGVRIDGPCVFLPNQAIGWATERLCKTLAWAMKSSVQLFLPFPTQAF